MIRGNRKIENNKDSLYLKINKLYEKYNSIIDNTNYPIFAIPLLGTLKINLFKFIRKITKIFDSKNRTFVR